MIDTAMLPDFIVEASEHLDDLESTLLDLERDPDNRPLLDDIFRAMHTIKGAAQFVGVERTATLSHRLENLLDLVRQGERELTPDLFDLLMAAKDRIAALVGELEDSGAETSEVDDLLARIEAVVDPGNVGQAAPAPSMPDAGDTGKHEPGAAAPAEQAASSAASGLLPPGGLDEEGDEELFSIFLDQLKENLTVIRDALENIESGVKDAAPLEKIAASLVSLQSSANYMGYDALAAFYAEWLNDVEKIKAAPPSGSPADTGTLKLRLARVMEAFPQVRLAPPEAGPETVSSRDAGAQSPEDEDDADGDDGSDEDDLFASLTSALDARLGLDTPDSPAAPPAATEQPGGLADESAAPAAEDGRVTPALDDAPTVAADAGEEDGQENDDQHKLGFLDNEVFEEDYDEELFAIFIDQLAEKMRAIRQCMAEFPASRDRLDLLTGCVSTIQRLKSAANYMGYAALTSLYSVWEGRIKAAIEELRAGREPSMDFMRSYMDHIAEAFPQINEKVEEQEGAADEAPSQPPPADTAADGAPSPASPADTGVAGPEDGESAVTRDTDSPAEGPPGEVEPPAGGPDDEDELFQRLSQALAAGLDSSGEESEAGDDGVIESMLLDAVDQDAAEAGADGEDALEDGAETAAEASAAPPVLEQEAATGQADARERTPELEAQVPDVPAAPAEDGDGEDSGRTAPEEGGTVQDRQVRVRQTMRVDAAKIDELMNQVGELVVSRSYFSRLVYEINSLQREIAEQWGLHKNDMKPLREFAFKLGEASVALGRVSNELQEGVMRVRMLPIDNLFRRYPRLVRDLARESGKQVDLDIRGEETELDKMVIEEISDPLIHIIRNAVDHGIESVPERRRAGKPETGRIILEAYHESNHIVIDVIDDGRGIDSARIRAKALSERRYSADELDLMSDQEVIRLVLQPGFSTAERATALSGRGVGMDVVKQNVEKLNGTIEIDSIPGQGTRVRIKIPLTLAIIQALIVQVARQQYAVPLSSVEETLRVHAHEVSEIEGVEVLTLREATLPIFSLSALFSGDRASSHPDKFYVVVVHSELQRIGLMVDALVGQEEVVIKPLADYLREQGSFSGATIMGDGSISLILDVPGLIKIATDKQVVLHREADAFHESAPQQTAKETVDA